MKRESTKSTVWPATAPKSWPDQARVVNTGERRMAIGGLWYASAWGNHSRESANDYVMVVTRSGWPMLAMESHLTRTNGRFVHKQRWDNERSIAAGLAVSLLHTRPHPWGEDGWISRRLPLRPLPLGFIVNSALWTLFILGLAWARRLYWLGARSPRYGRAPVILACAIGLNFAVSLGLWTKWQLASKPRQTVDSNYGDWTLGNLGVVSFHVTKATWPAKVPETWPRAPSWLGSGGEALGVRKYELTSHGIPTAAWAILSVTWGNDASDVHQNMNVVQVGWPLPALQSEELIEVQGRTSGTTDDYWDASMPLERRGAIWDVKLPGASPPVSSDDPAAIVPIRPLWFGFFANILLFASAIALLVWLPTAIRVHARIRKNHCVACGYDLQNIARCPECGCLTKRAREPVFKSSSA